MSIFANKGVPPTSLIMSDTFSIEVYVREQRAGSMPSLTLRP